MANVLVKIKVMPEGLEVNLDNLENEIKNKISPNKIEREPIAFGLEAILVTKIIPDDAKYLEEIETKIKQIEGVSSVETIEISRLLV